MPKLSCILLLWAFSQAAFAQQVPQSFTDGITAQFRQKHCVDHAFPATLCDQIISLTSFMALNGKNTSEIKDEVTKLTKSYLSNPDNLNAIFINSPSAKKLLGNFPLELEFTQLETNNSDAVLGLTYGFNYQVKKSRLNAGENAHIHYAISFNSTGTITKNAAENPHNFIDSKFTLTGKRLTNVPALSVAQRNEFRRLIDEDNIDNPASIAKANNMLMGAFTNPWFIEYGLEIGIESDQAFKAKNKKLSAFSYFEYEDMSKQSLLGDLGIVPSVRVALDSIQPNSDTPRALVGDKSSFTRASLEAGFWVPLGFKQLAFTFSYRTYQELGAAELVKTAGLDKTHLRTFTVTGPLGLFASYSSGSLPFSLSSEQTVQLGWKWHFSGD
ncbi:hypothetical protein [Paraglaciecola aestuariivivens]